MYSNNLEMAILELREDVRLLASLLHIEQMQRESEVTTLNAVLLDVVEELGEEWVEDSHAKNLQIDECQQIIADYHRYQVVKVLDGAAKRLGIKYKKVTDSAFEAAEIRLTNMIWPEKKLSLVES